MSDTFSTDERRRAKDLAVTDRRIQIALDTPDAGFTQVMAAGPQSVRHWEQAPAQQCYGQALITAALDACRVDAHAPLPREYFDDAVPGHLNQRQVATAPPDWLDGALDCATFAGNTVLDGATLPSTSHLVPTRPSSGTNFEEARVEQGVPVELERLWRRGRIVLTKSL